jgi:hypothetical protein
MYFQSDRDGTMDLWVASREDLDSDWGAPQKLAGGVNTPGFDGGPRLSVDGGTLYFFSSGHPGAGAVDLFVSERPRPDGACEDGP